MGLFAEGSMLIDNLNARNARFCMARRFDDSAKKRLSSPSQGPWDSAQGFLWCGGRRFWRVRQNSKSTRAISWLELIREVESEYGGKGNLNRLKATVNDSFLFFFFKKVPKHLWTRSTEAPWKRA